MEFNQDQMDELANELYGSTEKEESGPDYEKLLDEKNEAQKNQLQSSMYVATQRDPNQFGRVNKIAQKYGVQPAFVAENASEFEQKEKINAVDYDGIIKSNPKLAEFLKDPDNATLAQDDLDNLNGLSQSLDDHSLGEQFGDAFMGGLARMYSSLAKAPAYVYDVAALPQNLTYKAMGSDKRVRSPEWLRNNPVAQFYDEGAKAFAAEVPDLEKSAIDEIGKLNFKRAGKIIALQVVNNAPQQAANIGTMMVNPAAGMGLAFGTTAADKNAQNAENNIDPITSVYNATVHGSVEALFERLGTFGLLDKWGARLSKTYGEATAKEVLKETGKALGASFIGEANEEALTSIAQGMADKHMGVNPDLTYTEIFKDAGNSALVGGFSGFSMTGPVAIADAALGIRARIQRNQDLEFYRSLGDINQQSKLNERAPEKYKELLAQKVEGTSVENVYMPVEGVEEYFQSKGINPVKFMTEIGLTKEYEQAKTTGGNIEIPLATWVEKVGKSEHFRGLENNIKFNQDALTKNEEIKEQGKIKRLIQQAETEAQEKLNDPEQKAAQEKIENELNQVRQKLTEQLQSTGKYTPELINDQVNMIVGPLRYFSAANNKTPLEYLNEVNLNIRNGGEYQSPVDKQAAQVTDDLDKALGFFPEELSAPQGIPAFDNEGNRIFDENIISHLRQSIDIAEAGKRGTVKDEATGEVIGSIGTESSFPDFFKDKGYSKKETLKIIDKYLAGGKLTEQQQIIFNDLYDGALDKTNRGEYFQFAGQKALNAPIQKLQSAHQMKESGMDMEQIRKDTGWFMGPDNRWRFEISDENAKIKDININKKKKYKLSEVLDHKELFEAYPQLADINVVFGAHRGLKGGHFDRNKNEIKINVVKEAVQSEDDKKNMARLSELIESPEYKAYTEAYKNGSLVEKEKAKQAWTSSPNYQEFATLAFSLRAVVKPKSFPKQLGDAPLSIILHEVQHAIQRQEGFATGTNKREAGGFKNYQNTLGEVEARNVEARKKMTDAERAAAPPDVLTWKNPIINWGTVSEELPINSPDDINKMAQAGEQLKLFQSAAPDDQAPAFYFKTIQTIEQKMGNSADPAQIKGILKEMKPEELKWLGVDEYLKGKEKVSKADLLEYLRGNQIQLEEIVKSENSADRDSRPQYSKYVLPGGDNYREVLFKLPPPALKNELSPEDKDISTWSKSERSPFKQTPKQEVFDNEDFAKSKKKFEKLVKKEFPDMKPKAISEITERALESFSINGEPPAFDNAPGILREEFNNLWKQYRALRNPYPKETVYKKEVHGHRFLLVDTNIEGPQRAYIFNIDRSNNKYYPSIEAAIEDIGSAVNIRSDLERKDLYRSSHFDEANILAHTRLDDRVDADGNKVLFIEEIQSDWHQAGRKKGYKGEDAKKAESEFNEYGKKLAEKYDLNPLQNIAMFAKIKNIDPAEIQEYERLQSAWLSFEKSEIPDAPLKKTWHEFVLKRIIREAAEKGYDKIAWTTGEQQAERYDLSKQVDEIAYQKNQDGTYKLSFQAQGRGHLVGEALVENDLSDQIGKEMADKILKGDGQLTNFAPNNEPRNEWKVLKGGDLKIGGEGMKGFYDKILVDYAKKFGKKFGSEVSTSEIKVSDEPRKLNEISQAMGLGEWGALTKEQQDQVIEARDKEQAAGFGTTAVHSMTITPELKKVALNEGFSFFQSQFAKNQETDQTQFPMPKSVRIVSDQEIGSESQGKYVNVHTGFEISFSSNSIKKAVNQATNKLRGRVRQIHLETLQLIPKLLENAVYLTESKDLKNRKQEWKYFFAPLQVDGVDQIVKLQVKKDNKGRYILHNYAVVPAGSGSESQAVGVQAATALPAGEIPFSEFSDKVKALRESYNFFQDEANPRARVIFDKYGISIDLFKGADPTSLMHEMGHVYLEMFKTTYKSETAPDWLKADAEKILKYLGVESFDDIKVEHHELWARSVEKYLYDGKAPTDDLSGTFARLKMWFRKVYTDVKSALGVELNDEIKEVMDRVFAGEPLLLKADAQYAPLLTDTVVRTMTPEKQEEYKALLEKYRAKATQSVTEKLMEQHNKERRKWWKAELEKRQEIIRGELAKTRQYMAQNYIKTGILPGQEPAKDERAHKINRESLKKAFGKVPEWANRSMTHKEGADVQLISDLLGFKDLAAFNEEMSRVEDIDVVAKQMAEEQMKSEFGDILEDQEALKEMVEKAVHNEKKAEVLRKELEFLASEDLAALKGLIRKIARRPPKDEIVRARAEKIIAEKTIKEIQPWAYQRAEAKAAAEAADEFAKGNFEAAFDAKQRELLNFYLYREAIRAKDLINEKIKSSKKVFEGSQKDVAEKRDWSMVSLARVLLGEFGITDRDIKSVYEYLDQLQQYDEDAYEGLKPLVTKWLIDKKDYREMSMQRFSEFFEDIEALWSLSKSSRELEINGVKHDIEEVAVKLGDRLSDITDKPYSPGLNEAPTDKEKTVDKFMSFKSSMQRIEAWIDIVDSGDETKRFETFMLNPVREAVTQYRLKKTELLEKYKELAEKLGKNSKLDYGKISASEINYTFKDKAELLAALLHTGNDSNLYKLLAGRKWGDVDVDTGAVDPQRWNMFIDRMHRENILTQADWDFVQGIWDLNESIKPDAQKAHKDMYGYFFNEVTHKKFITPFGEYRGGYMPAITDSFLVEDSRIRQEQDMLLNNNNSFMFPTTGRGFTKARVERYAAPLLLDMNMVGNHFDKVLRFTYIEPTIKKVAKINNKKDYRAVLRQYDPYAGTNLINPWLQRSAQQRVVQPSQSATFQKFDGVAKFLRASAGLQILGLNLSNAMQQLTGTIVASSKVNPKYLIHALGNYTTEPNVTKTAIIEMSPWMRTRLENGSMQLADDINKVLFNPSAFEKASDYARKNGMILSEMFQHTVDIVVWQGAYSEALDQGMSKEEAILRADKEVRLTQGSANAEDISSIEEGTHWTRLFTQFYGYFNMQANLLGAETAKKTRALGWKSALPTLLPFYISSYLIPGLVAQTIAQMMSGKSWDADDDGEIIDDVAWMTLTSMYKGLFAMVPMVGQFANMIIGQFTNEKYDDRMSLSPAMQQLENVGRSAFSTYKVLNGEDLKGQEVKSMLTTLGFVTGMPIGPMGKPIGYLKDISEGNAEPTGPIDFARGLTTGRDSQK